MSHPVWIALLRSINLGGHNRLKMQDLRELVGDLGGLEVRTHIQSGNVVFRGAPELPWAERLTAALRERHQLEVPVALRSVDELLEASRHPFLDEGLPAEVLHVSFLLATPTARTLDTTRYAPDRALLQGRHVFLAYPGGLGRSKLTGAVLDRRLGVQGTVRNLGVVRALVALAT